MSESSPAPRSHKDPVRIVYYAGNRTFARLFNEHSLEDMKNVVRQKLGLEANTDVLLKQMGSGTLLDLDDDGDFQAFRVLLKSSVSADIQVTVGPSQGPAMPSPVAPPQDRPSAGEPSTTAVGVSPSKEPIATIMPGRPDVQPDVVPIAEVATTPTETPLARKRKASLDHGVVAASDKPAEQRLDQPSAHPEVPRTTKAPAIRKSSIRKRVPSPTAVGITEPDRTTDQPAQGQSIAVTPVSFAKTVEPPASKPGGAEEPPKKKQKKEPKRKAVQIAESPAPKSSSSRPKLKKSTALDRGSKADANAPDDSEPSEPLVKKQRKHKKDDTADKKKSTTLTGQDGMNQPISLPIPHAGPSAEDETSETRKGDWLLAPKGTVCASIPQTNASTFVRSEVAAAILSGYLSKASEPVPPEPPARRRSARRVTRNFSVSSSPLPTEPISVLDTPANETPTLSAEDRPEQVVRPNRPPQTPDPNGPPCPICLREPFHIRYCCPTVLKGPDAIRERLRELKRTNMGDQQSLIKQLEGLLRDSEVAPEPSLDAMVTDDAHSEKVSSQHNDPLPEAPNIPSTPLAEVTAGSGDEDSSTESSDDTSGGLPGHQELPARQSEKASDEQPSPSCNGLESAICSPATRKSLLAYIDRIAAEEDDEGSSSEEDEAELEEDSDEETGRSKRRCPRRITRSSESESEEEESRSPSPSRSDEYASKSFRLGVQNSNKSAMDLAKHQEGDVVMEDPVNPPVLDGKNDGKNEETQIGSEDRMAVDDSVGENGAAIIAQDQPSPSAAGASVLRHSDTPSNEPQEAAKTQAELVLNGHARVSLAPEVPKEVEADPIEPADDLALPTVSRSMNTDPVEAPSENLGSLFTDVAQLSPNPGVSKRIKTRDGQVLDDEADRPVLLERLAQEATDEVTPIPAKGKLRRKVTETPASQEQEVARWRSPRFSSIPPSTSAPAAAGLLNYRAKTRKATKTPAKQSEERSDVLKGNGEDGAAQDGTYITRTPSLLRWETLAEPSSPSLQTNEPSATFDELMSSSPQADDIFIHGRSNDKATKGRPRRSAASSQAKNSQEKERLFDLTPSQIPFPYSQKRINLVPTPLVTGKECVRTSDSEEEAEVAKKRTRMPVKYRPLSQLASQAFFSPSLPTPSSSNRSVINGKAKKRAAEESSSSSSSSDENEANGSEHIPRGRRAGSVLDTKKKSLLSRI